MEAVEQGRVTLSGIPCEGAPFQLRIRQGFNSHGVLEGAIWIPEEASQPIVKAPVVLDAGKQGMAPLFCGIVTSFAGGRERGRRCAYIRVQTGSIQMDGIRRRRSFQNQNRSYEQLSGLIASPYQALCAWESAAGAQPINRFFLQYEETDWEFLKRVASEKGCSILVEARLPRPGFYIGLPDGRKETELKAEQYRVRNRMAGCVEKDGTISAGLEYVVQNRYEILEPGDRVRFQGQRLVVAEKEIVLQNGLLQSSYILRPETGFQAEVIKNYRMIGAAVPGTVLESSPDMSRLHLSTDAGEETAQSWHRRSVFYTGSGKGYGGRPESGDTMYLYFPTEHESDRTVIGGAGAGYEQLEAVTQQIMDDTESETEKAREQEQQAALENAAGDLGLTAAASSGMTGNTRTGSSAPRKAGPGTTHKYKNWSTPKGKTLSLNGGGIRLQNGGGRALNLTGQGVMLQSAGTLQMKGTDPVLGGKQVRLQAKEYVYLKCGMSEVLLLPNEIHVKGTEVYLESVLNEDKGPVCGEGVIEEAKAAYYEEKWGNPLQLFMPDGTPIGIHEKEMMNHEGLRNYFKKNVLGTEGYVNYLANPELDKYYEDGTIEVDSREQYEGMLYRKWLSDTYGKTKWEKFMDMLSTREGMHMALDAAGLGFELADAANSVIYLTEGDLKNAGISFLSCLPLLGDTMAKGGKYVAKGIDAIKLARPGSKAVKMLDSVTVYAKARRADIRKVEKIFQKWTDDVSDMLTRNPYVEVAMPDGQTFRMPVNRSMDVSLELVDEAGTKTRYSKVIEGGSGTKAFKSQQLLDEHFTKHGGQLKKAFNKSEYTIADYLDDANYVINNGTYVSEMNGYVKLVGGEGSAKYAFVGLDRVTGEITTLHLKAVSELMKKAPSLGIQ